MFFCASELVSLVSSEPKLRRKPHPAAHLSAEGGRIGFRRVCWDDVRRIEVQHCNAWRRMRPAKYTFGAEGIYCSRLLEAGSARKRMEALGGSTCNILQATRQVERPRPLAGSCPLDPSRVASPTHAARLTRGDDGMTWSRVTVLHGDGSEYDTFRALQEFKEVLASRRCCRRV